MSGRIGRFLRAARSLLLAQAAAALLVLGLAVWAFVEVRELAAERDRLQSRVHQLEAKQPPADPLAGSPPVLPPEPLPPRPFESGAPPVAVPVPIPVEEPKTEEPAPKEQEAEPPPPAEEPRTAPDCTGAAANSVRCRPGRWTRPPQRPVARPPIARPPVTTPADGNQPKPPR